MWYTVRHMAKKRYLTGDRPTGPLHLGHYFGSLKNRMQFQEEGKEGFIIIADFQVVTDRLETDAIEQNIIELTKDYLAAGIDPQKTTIFVQSHIHEISVLTMLFSMIVTVPQLERNPTIKEEAKAMGQNDKMSLGMLSYPVSQAADILLFQPGIIPVGVDQAPHIELTRDIAARFNRLYGETFVIPEMVLSPQSRLLGLDGTQKMSKSRGNAIFLKDSEEEIFEKVKKATTDSEAKIYFDEEKRPAVSNLLLLFSLTSGRTVESIVEEFGNSGNKVFKEALSESINNFLSPMRARREQLDEEYVKNVIREGTKRAQAVAHETLTQVREHMRFAYPSIFN